MVIPTHDKNTRATWISRLAAYKEVEQWARDLTHQQETEWFDAFTDDHAEALVEYFEATNGLSDAVFMFSEYPADANLPVWAEYLSELRDAVKRLESKIAVPPCTDEAWSVCHWVKGALTDYEAAYGRTLIARDGQAAS